MSRNKEFFTTVNGVTGFVPPRRDQTHRLYDSEYLWAHNHAPAGQTISEQGAKDMLGEIMNHSSLDEFPDIRHIRNSWSPGTHVTFDPYEQGMAETTSAGTINFNPLHKLRVGTVTHEAAHLANVLGHQFIDNEGNFGQGFAHEWPFAATHLHIVHNLMGGKDASIPLKNAYRMFGVQWMPKHRIR